MTAANRGLSPWGETGFRLRGEAEYALGRFESAALSFLRALDFLEKPERGILAARAGAAFEQADMYEDAARLYSQAALDLPQLRGWLAVREASVSSDTVYSFSLLSSADP